MEYDVFGLNDIKNVATFAADVKHFRVHENNLCSALQLTFSHRTISPKRHRVRQYKAALCRVWIYELGDPTGEDASGV